jgi:NDP-sugar pyrophosphorylase family protein
MDLLLKADLRVNSHPFTGYWLDIGRHEDYATVAAEVDTLGEQFFGPVSILL